MGNGNSKTETNGENQLTEAALQDLLRGKTSQIYYYLLTQGETGVRELQRQFSFSSPNVVVHHIKKLVEAELVWQNPAHGKYEIKLEVKTGVMALYTRVGKFLIPQNVFLVAFFVTMALSYTFLVLIPRGFFVIEDFFFLVITIIGTFFFIRQSLKIWQLKPV